MKTKLRLLAAVLIAGGTMFAQSRPFVNNGAGGSGSHSFRTGTTYNQANNNVFRSESNYRSGNAVRENAVRYEDRGRDFHRADNRDRFRDDRRFDNRWETRRAYVDDCRR
jgi:hypothetical protein